MFVRPNVRTAQLLANPSAETRIHFVIVPTAAVSTLRASLHKRITRYMSYRHLIVIIQCKPALILIGKRRTRQRQFWSGRIGYLKSRPQHSLFHVGRGVRTPCTNLHIWPVLQPTPIMRRKKTRSDTYLSGRWMDSSEVSDIIY